MQKDLTKYGVTVSNYIYPNGQDGPNQRGRHWVSQWYNAARVGGSDNLNTTPITELGLSGQNFESDQVFRTNLQSWLDTIASNTGLGIVFSHEPGDTTRVRYLIQDIKSRGIRITALRDSLRSFGNYIRAGDFEVLRDRTVNS